MSPTRLLPFALLSPLMLSASPAAAEKGFTGGYLDFLVGEGVGELRSQQYDAYRTRDGSDVFVGNQSDRGTLLAAGFGLRIVMATKSGLRFSGEGSLQGGRIVAGGDPLVATSGVTRGELLTGLGYQFAIGPVVLHAAGILGADYASMKIAPPVLTTLGLSSASGGTQDSGQSPLSEDITLKRWGLRAGVQAGAHVQLSKLAALYGDATFDYDGQWRTRFGISFGDGGRR